MNKFQVLAKPGTVTAHDHVETQIYFLPKSEGGTDRPRRVKFNCKVFSKTWEVAGFFTLKGRELAMPGEDCTYVDNKYCHIFSYIRLIYLFIENPFLRFLIKKVLISIMN